MAENFTLKVDGDLEVTGRITSGGMPGEYRAVFSGEGLEVGQAVKISSSYTVALCGDGEDFCGVVKEDLGNGTYSVQIGGLTEFKYSRSAPRVGLVNLCGNGSGGVNTVTAGGQRVLVVAVNTSTGTVVIKL